MIKYWKERKNVEHFIFLKREPKKKHSYNIVKWEKWLDKEIRNNQLELPLKQKKTTYL